MVAQRGKQGPCDTDKHAGRQPWIYVAKPIGWTSRAAMGVQYSQRWLRMVYAKISKCPCLHFVCCISSHSFRYNEIHKIVNKKWLSSRNTSFKIYKRILSFSVKTRRARTKLTYRQRNWRVHLHVRKLAYLPKSASIPVTLHHQLLHEIKT